MHLQAPQWILISPMPQRNICFKLLNCRGTQHAQEKTRQEGEYLSNTAQSCYTGRCEGQVKPDTVQQKTCWQPTVCVQLCIAPSKLLWACVTSFCGKYPTGGAAATAWCAHAAELLKHSPDLLASFSSGKASASVDCMTRKRCKLSCARDSSWCASFLGLAGGLPSGLGDPDRLSAPNSLLNMLFFATVPARWSQLLKQYCCWNCFHIAMLASAQVFECLKH